MDSCGRFALNVEPHLWDIFAFRLGHSRAQMIYFLVFFLALFFLEHDRYSVDWILSGGPGENASHRDTKLQR